MERQSFLRKEKKYGGAMIYLKKKKVIKSVNWQKD